MAMTHNRADSFEGAEPIRLKVPEGHLHADLTRPEHATGIVVFAHGSGSSRHSPRNRQVARMLEARGFATLLADLLTPEEEAVDRQTGHFRFDIARLGRRTVAMIDWLGRQDALATLPIGLFGASTGAAAALVAAAERPDVVAAVVSRGGRPDLAGPILPRVAAPTLLLVGSLDEPVIEMNREAQRLMPAIAQLEVVPGATHLFQEPGTLEHVATRAADWFARYLVRDRTGRAAAGGAGRQVAG
jgi:putative phosphoribosyl transferase